ncbi:MAG: hypothetical protein RL385_4078, partial [Pseudomonadota bacterium]
RALVSRLDLAIDDFAFLPQPTPGVAIEGQIHAIESREEPPVTRSLRSENDHAMAEIVRGKRNRDTVAQNNANAVLAHAPAQTCPYDCSGVCLDLELPAGKDLSDYAVQLDVVVANVLVLAIAVGVVIVSTAPLFRHCTPSVNASCRSVRVPRGAGAYRSVASKATCGRDDTSPASCLKASRRPRRRRVLGHHPGSKEGI